MTLSIETDDRGAKLTLWGGWSDSDMRLYREAGLRRLELNHAKGFRADNLDFLKELGDLESLVLIDLNIADIQGIHALHGLRELEVMTYDRGPLDFSQFPRLERLVLEWRTGADSVFACRTLRQLYLNGYPDADLRRLSALDRVDRLEIGNGSRLSALDGIEALRSLAFLGLYRLPRLASLHGVDAIGESLVRLEVDSCRKLTDVDPLIGCSQLRLLRLSDCGAIASLTPLRGLAELQTLLFDGTTNVGDGDLGVLPQMPRLREVAFQNRRHYSHTRTAIEAALAG